MYFYTEDGVTKLSDNVERHDNGALVISRGLGYIIYSHISKCTVSCNHLAAWKPKNDLSDLCEMLIDYSIIVPDDVKDENGIIHSNVYVSGYFVDGYYIAQSSVHRLRNDIKNRFGINPYGSEGIQIYNRFVIPCCYMAKDENDMSHIRIGLYDAEKNLVVVSKSLFELYYDQPVDYFARRDKLIDMMLRKNKYLSTRHIGSSFKTVCSLTEK